jgi:hypothetical protein
VSAGADSVAVIAAIIAAAAAICSAIISALFGVSVSRRTASQKLAEMRQLWIEDLRNHLADFVGAIHRITNVSATNYPLPDKQKSLEDLNSSIMRLESYISLKLNHDEVAPARLVNVIKHTRGAAAYISGGASLTDFIPRILRHLSEVDEVARYIFKIEWNRASDEIRPVTREKRKEREASLREWYSKIPDTCTKFESPNPLVRSKTECLS